MVDLVDSGDDGGADGGDDGEEVASLVCCGFEKASFAC